MAAKKTPHAAIPGSNRNSLFLIVLLPQLAWTGLLAWQTLQHFKVYPKPLFQLLGVSCFGDLQMPLFISHWLSTGKNLVLLLAFVLAAYGVGRWLLTRFISERWSRLQEGIYSLGVGFGVLSLLIFVLGIFGLYQPWLFAGLLFPAAAWGGWTAWQHAERLRGRPGWLFSGRAWPELILSGILLGFFALIALTVNTPELFFDSLVYHLALPSHWLRIGGLGPVPTNFFSNLPMSIEMLYTGALMLGDERLCRMLHATLGLLTGLAIFAFGRQWFGKRAGFWAAGMFLTIPLVAMNMLESGVDVGAAFFSVLGVSVFWEWSFKRASAPGGSRQPWLAGWVLGAALAAKYNTAFVLGPAIAVGMVLAYRQGADLKTLLRATMKIAATGALLVLPWMLKSAIYTGNPVYPFLHKVIPSKYIHPNKMQQQMDGFREYGQRNWVRFLRQPWDLTFYQPTSNSYAGVVWLLLLPALLGYAIWRRRGPPVWMALAITTGLAALIWSSQTQITRYFTPVFPLLAVLCAAVLDRWEKWNRLLGLVGRAGVLGLAAWGLAVTWNLGLANWDPVGASLGLESRASYLDRKLMNSYSALARKVNQLPGKVKVLLVGETRSYYFTRPVTAATVYDYNPFIDWIAAAPSAEAVWQQLRQEGYTHLAIYYPEASRTRGYEPYRWDGPALERLRQLLAHYVQGLAVNGEQRLYRVREEPRTDLPVKLGRPLFTYDPEVVGTVLQHHRQAGMALRQGKLQDARARWMRILQLAPEWDLPYAELGWYHLQVNQPEEAFRLYQAADRLGWLDPGSYNNLGVQYLRRNQINAARRCFTQALELDPELEIVKKNLELLDQKTP